MSVQTSERPNRFGRLATACNGKASGIATYRVLNPHGDVVDTKEIESAEDAHAWFVGAKAVNSELGWRMEVESDDGWSFFDDSEGSAD
jgi:hypothetical protein